MIVTVSPLRIFRTARGLTQSQLAELARMYQQRVSLIERGSTPVQSEIERLAEALDITPEELFPIEVER